MKNFTYIKPANLTEASRLLGKDWQGALPFAGGTDLLGLMKDGIESPGKLINLKALAGLDQVRYIPGKGLHIGALVTIAEIAGHELIRRKYRVLAQAAGEVASPQLRSQGTIAGNLCQRPRCWYFRADFHCLRKGGDVCYAVTGENKFHCVIAGAPCFIVHPSDTAPALLALDASVKVFSGKKYRQVPLREFFVLPDRDVTRENVLQPGEIITEILVPDVPDSMRSGYLKIKERDVWDFATVSAAAVLEIAMGRVRQSRVVLGGVAPVPWFEDRVSNLLGGMAVTGGGTAKKLAQVAAGALTAAEPLEQNGYKVPLARTAVKRLLSRLLA